MLWLLYVVAGLSIIYIYCRIIRQGFVLPHGIKETPIEKGLPIIGVLRKMKSPLSVYLKHLGAKHGSLFRIKLGMRDLFILNDFEMIRKCLIEDGQNFSGRVISSITQASTHESGIMFIDGEVWSKQRTFVLKVLRDFGLGKSKSLEIVENECGYLVEELQSLRGKAVDFGEVIPIYIANIISEFIMNKRFNRDDPKISVIENVINKIGKQRDFLWYLDIMFPIFEYLYFIPKLMLMVSHPWRKIMEIHSIFQKEIEEHKQRLDLNSKGEDLIDRFLIEQHKLKENTGSIQTFTNWQLIQNLFELFIAGYETISTTLGWSMTFMARYPDIQNRVYDEIIDVIGKERSPSLNDKKSLDYTQAVMDEIFRLSSVVQLSIFHRVFHETYVNGYVIPANSWIIPNIFACHTDQKTWKKPMEFYPEHFLTSDENGKLKYTPRDELIPFGIGKRQCLGESLARMEYFIFFLSIIQKLEVKFAKEVDNERFEEALKGNDGVIRFSKIKDFIFTQR